MQVLSVKVPEPIMERIEQHADEMNESRSVAARDLIRTGLDAKDQNGITVPLPVALMWWGSLAVTAGAVREIEPVPAVTILGLALLIAGALLSSDRATQALSGVFRRLQTHRET